jgi:hypothetical protein
MTGIMAKPITWARAVPDITMDRFRKKEPDLK